MFLFLAFLAFRVYFFILTYFFMNFLLYGGLTAFRDFVRFPPVIFSALYGIYLSIHVTYSYMLLTMLNLVLYNYFVQWLLAHIPIRFDGIFCSSIAVRCTKFQELLNQYEAFLSTSVKDFLVFNEGWQSCLLQKMARFFFVSFTQFSLHY